MSELAVEKFDQEHDFDQYIGFLDLDTHPKWLEIWQAQDEARFKKVLHYFGADTEQGFMFDQCIYRARRSDLTPSQQVEFGMVVRFKERTDKWWQNNMMCIEDVVRHTQNSIRATGMREALNEDSSLNDLMIEQAAKFAINVDIKCDMGELNNLTKEVA